MSERLKSMKRVLSVQAKIKRLADVRLMLLEQRKGELAEQQLQLAGYLDGLDGQGELASLTLRQGQRLAARRSATERDHAAQAEAVLQAQSRLKLTERLVDDIAREQRQAEERRDLERLIESLVGRDAVSSGPGGR